MQIGTYADGRPLNYDESGKQFNVGGSIITPSQVIEYDRAQQLTWTNDDLRNWAYQYAANVETGNVTAPPKKGWFTNLPIWAKVLFIIVYPISMTYGVIVMWRDKRFSQGLRIAITAAAVIFLLAVGISANAQDASKTATTAQPPRRAAATTPQPATVTATETPKPAAVPSAPPAPAPKPKPKPAPPAPVSTATYLRKVVNDVAGEKTNTGDKPTVRDVQDMSKGVFLLSLNASENLTNNMTKKGMWIDSKDVWKRVFIERTDVNEVIIHWYFPLVDVKGNESDGQVMTLVMTKKNASDVKWDNVLIDNIPRIADEYHESPVLSK